MIFTSQTIKLKELAKFGHFLCLHGQTMVEVCTHSSIQIYTPEE